MSLILKVKKHFLLCPSLSFIAVTLNLSAEPHPIKRIDATKKEGQVQRSIVDEFSPHPFRDLSQGNELGVLPILAALTNNEGQPMLDRLIDYGFLERGSTEAKVPVGFTIKENIVNGLDFSRTGLSCAACHSGEILHDNTRYRIDGMPGMVDIEGWMLELSESVSKNFNSRGLANKKFFQTAYRTYKISREWGRLNKRRNKGGQKSIGDMNEDIFLAILDQSLSNFTIINEKDEDISNIKSSETDSTLKHNTQSAKYVSRPLDPRNISEDPIDAVIQLAFFDGLLSEEEKKQQIDGISENWDQYLIQRNKELENQYNQKNNSGNKSRGISRWLLGGFPRQSYLQKTKEVATNIRMEFNLIRERYDITRKLISGLKKGKPAGLGRDDAWSVIDLTVPIVDQAEFNAPVSIPALFGTEEFSFFHYDGNTNSLMDRNIAQVVALGAKVHRNGNSTIALNEIHEANNYVNDLYGPDWSSIFGPMTEDSKQKAIKGKKLFEDKKYTKYIEWDIYNKKLHDPNDPTLKIEAVSCADCHANPSKSENQKFYQVGTSEARLKYHSEDDPTTFNKMKERLEQIRETTIAQAREGLYLPQNIAKWEKFPSKVDWWIRKGYVARPLDGIWLTAPYLNNGSVSSLKQLLTEPEDRKLNFWIGNREFNQKEVGFKDQRSILSPSQIFTVNSYENSNSGHDFGHELEKEQKMHLIEYLKTFSKGSRLGDK